MSTGFADALKSLVARELADGGSDSERMGAAVEAVASALGLIAATATKGDPAAMDKVLEGSTQYVFEQAAFYQRFAQMMGRVHGRQ